MPAFLKPLARIFSLLLLLGLAGCAAAPKIDWNSRIGNYTIDQSILEFGPPDNSAKLTDGATIAQWLIQRGYSHGYVGGGYATGPIYGRYDYVPTLQPFATTTTPSRYLRLTFSPDGKLTAWKHVEK